MMFESVVFTLFQKKKKKIKRKNKTKNKIKYDLKKIKVKVLNRRRKRNNFWSIWDVLNFLKIIFNLEIC